MTDQPHIPTLRDTLAAATDELLALRNEQGYWEGELSSSALSTATAVCALRRYLGCVSGLPEDRRRAIELLVRQGLAWLAAHQNDDGGFGDTTLSLSNISTTALCWAAFSGEAEEYGQAEKAVRAWLADAAGGLDPPTLAAAIRRRYGKDHTFSVPILTTLALHDRLGAGRDAWRLAPQLPFELAACPPAWYAKVKLPVVSYALPALIAIGLVRHSNRPTRNPLTRSLRGVARRRVLKVLQSIQPEGGGFLEATPLTSFVTLGLLGAGEAACPVVEQAVDFLVRSARPDGSWPIDTNLATWVTTLSVNALDAGGGVSKSLPPREQGAVRNWLRGQQLEQVHPYTQAAPGGWAWTDLPGGVPDADDTPGALLALRALADADEDRARLRESAIAGIGWLVDLQNADGGMPTFCRGWGTLPFDRSSCDITAHGLRALHAWRSVLPEALAHRARRAERVALAYLTRQQRPDGGWAPLWFGNQHAATVDETNLTYGTSRVLVALAEIGCLAADGDQQLPNAVRGLQFMLSLQNEDGGWGGAPATPSSIEETALAVEALAACADCAPDGRVADAVRRGAAWLVKHTAGGREFPATPIGFYFAKLWYYEQMYPVVYTVAALGRAIRVLEPSAVPPHVEAPA